MAIKKTIRQTAVRKIPGLAEEKQLGSNLDARGLMGKVRDRGLGLGLAPSQIDGFAKTLGACADDTMVAAILRDALACPVTTTPNIEHTTWDVTGPVNADDLVKTFGPEIKLFNEDGQVAGVSEVQSTFVHSGILQTGIIVTAVGFHVFADPVCFTALGNSMVAPETGVASPASPDVFSSLAGGAPPSITPAQLWWGWPMQYAAWHFMNAYNFEWIVRNRYHLLDESARYIAYFSSYADEFGAGTSQVPVIDFAQRTNAHYRSLGATSIFLPVEERRLGFVPTGGVNTQVFQVTRDFDLADATWGGLQLQQKLSNAMFRKLTLPYFIPAGIPIGLQLRETDEVQGDLFRRYLGSDNGSGAGIVPPVLTADVNILAANDAGLSELGLDGTTVAAQGGNVSRVVYKGGTIEFSMLIKGFEVTDDFARAMTSPTLKTALTTEFGIQFCS